MKELNDCCLCRRWSCLCLWFVVVFFVVIPPCFGSLGHTMTSMSDIDGFLRRMSSTKPDNCSMENLGPGVVQGLARDRFKRQAHIAVTRANLLTYLWKYNPDYLYRESVLYWLVSNLVESDEDIFAAGNCYDFNQFKSFGIFCPYAFRNKKEGTIIVKDLARTHHYDNELSTEHEWFHEIRRIGLRIINNTRTRKESVVNFFLPNDDANKTYSTLVVNYDDGHWSLPYYDCGGGNIWMITYTVPFFGYDRLQRSYAFKGTSGIDIDLMQVDINQCSETDNPTVGDTNIFANTHKCKPSTKCSPINGLGFQRGSYKCYCRDGYYFPLDERHVFDENLKVYFFNGTEVEQEYDKKQDGDESLYDLSFECLQCAPGCDTCEDDKPCLYPINWALRAVLLSVNVLMMCSVCGWSVLIRMFQEFKPIKAASPLLLQIILFGALLSYTPMIVHFFEPQPVLCTLQFWPREIGFATIYASILFKTWRIAVVFRPTQYRNVKITDVMLLKRIAMAVSAFAAFCVIRTAIGRPEVVMVRHSNGMKTFSCSFDVWDFSVAGCKLLLLIWGVWLSILVRKTPSEFNESRFISWAIYNETIMSIFFNISMFFLHSSGNPDLFYILIFLHSQLTVTGTTAFLFASKAYHLVKAIKSGEVRQAQKPRRFVPSLASKMSNAGGTSSKSLGGRQLSRHSSVESPSCDAEENTSPGLVTPAVAHQNLSHSHQPASSAELLKTKELDVDCNEKSSSSTTTPSPNNKSDIEQQLLLPRLSKLQEQIDSLRDEVSRVNHQDGKKKLADESSTVKPTLLDVATHTSLRDQSSTAMKHIEVTFDVGSVPTPKSQSESSCKSPTSRSTDDENAAADSKRNGDLSPLLLGKAGDANAVVNVDHVAYPSTIISMHNGNVIAHANGKTENGHLLNGDINGRNGDEDGDGSDDGNDNDNEDDNNAELDNTVISKTADVILPPSRNSAGNNVPSKIWVKRNGKPQTIVKKTNNGNDNNNGLPHEIVMANNGGSQKNIVKCMQFTYV